MAIRIRQIEAEWNPYVGPRPFRRDLDDQIRFFGRDEETEQILSLIYGHQLVLIYAQSGAGKTSLFNAQVVPELEKNGFQVLPVVRVGISSSNIIKSTHKENVGVDSEASFEINPYVLNTLQSLMPKLSELSLKNEVSVAEFLRDNLSHQIDQRNKPIPQVIIFDQLEELFNLYSDPNRWREQQQDFFEQVADALESDPLLSVIFIIREDYLAQLDPFASLLPERLRPRFRLERLNKYAAFEAIKGPLEKAKAFVNDERLITKLFDEGIIDKLIEDLLKIHVETFGGKFREAKGEFVEPIQLQVVCQRLWNKLKTSQVGQINQSYFEYLEDVDKALGAFYVETITETSKQTGVGEDTIRNWFEENLITSSGTRGIVHREFESTGGIPNTAVDILEKKYLIRKEERSGAQWYELTHDRFIKPILDSNKEWKDKLEREKEKAFTELYQKAVTDIVRRTSSTLYVLLHGPSKLQSENVDQVLAAFYERVIKKSIKKTRIEEDELRNWCENKLITSGGTLSVVHEENGSVGGIPDVVAGVLEEEYLIRKEECSGAQCYQLTHDRLIKPIKDSNKKWHDDLIIRKQSKKLKITIPITIAIIVLTTYAVSTFYISSPLHLSACRAGQTVSLEGSSSAIDSNLKTNKTYVASSDFNKLFAIDHNSCTVYPPIEVGKNPLGVAVDPKLNKVYVANNDSNTISVIAGQSNSGTSDPVPVGRGPDAVAVDLNTSKAYVANSKDNTISVIDGRTDTILGKPIPVGQYPQAVAIDPNSHKVYVANQGDNTISVIDGRTDTVLAKPIPVGRGPAFVAIDPKMQKVYVASKQGKSVSVIDIKTDKVVDTIAVGRGLNGLTVDTKTDKVYVSDSHPNSIYIIDGQNNSVIKTVHLNNTAGLIFFNPITNLMYHLSGSELSILNPPINFGGERDIIPVGMAPLDVKFDLKTNKLYVANFRDKPLGTVSVIDPKTNKLVGNIKVGMGPDGIAIDPTTNKAYVSNLADNTTSIIDLKKSKVVDEISVGHGPYNLAIDLNARKVYVANHDDDTVSVIDLNTNKVVATVKADRGPYAVAVNPYTGKVYVANAKASTLSVIDGRTNTLVGEIPVDTGPEAVAVDPTGGKAYVANYLDDTVSVIDLNTNKVVDKKYLEDGSAPDGVTVAAGKAYISNSKTDSVSVIDLKTGELVSKAGIKVGSNPEAVAVDPTGGKAYVADYRDNTLSIIKLYGTSASKLKS